MKTKITTEEEAREAISAVSDYLLARRSAEPKSHPFDNSFDKNPTEKLTREMCHELLSAGIIYSSNCDLCKG